MDAVALGHVEGSACISTIIEDSLVLFLGGWSAARQRIAEKYKEGGYPELYDFITA